MNRYRQVLSYPHAWVLVSVALPARIAYEMILLDIFFKAQRDTNSIAIAGLALGLNSVTTALTAGIRGMLMDKYGQSWPILVLVTAYVSMMIFLNNATDKNTILLFALILGVSAPPINLSVRPLWRSVVPDSELRVAYAIDTAVMNLASVIGPILATTLSLSSRPESALYVTAGCMALGGYGLAFSRVSRTWRPERIEKKQLFFRYRSMQLLAIEGAVIGLGWGLFDIAVPAFATLEDVPHLTAWILGAMGTATVIGGLLGGLVSKHRSSLRTLISAYMLWIVVSIPIIFSYPGWSMAIAGFFLGLVGGALQVFYWEVLELTRPKGYATASLGWLWTIEGTFMALGSAIGGWLSDMYSPRICFALTTSCLILGLTILQIGKSLLRDADRAPTDLEEAEAISDVPSANT